MWHLLRHFIRSSALCALLTGCVTIPRSCPPPKVTSWEDLRVWASSSKAGALIRGQDKIVPSDPRFDRMLCFDSDDFESFYLRHVLGIDETKADTE